ncbi:MAG: hypothetical protein K2X62_16390 [Beijerinckiaceae bacterium]|jgi:hypothetical protein|nr:hypothetical protein [Beijerinckiaceae bacterium]MDO9439578.1 hypothetical protein [Beijerinckiaceae bacterium]
MDRRLFIQSLLGVAGSAVAVTALSTKAQASTLMDELQAMDAAAASPVKAAAAEADLPAEGAAEAQYYYRRRYAPRRRFYYARPRYRRRCVVTRNRWGRLVRRCW